jgi:serine/threonine-protein kinase
VYALGVVLFELVTGAWPFVRRSARATANLRLSSSHPPLAALIPSLPPMWEAIIGRCLERDPLRRFARVEEILALFDEMTPPSRPSGSTPSGVRRTPRPREIVGDYELLEQIGAGGMGTVFSAVHRVIGKRAAIKVIRPELATDAAAVARFVKEARAVNQIRHPNIVDIFDLGELPSGLPYLVMEFLEGESLRARVARGPIAVDEVRRVLAAVCRALEAAHAQGVIHRDLKPDNVFLVGPRADGSGEATVKILDFGIAKLQPGVAAGPMERTATGNVVGTPLYMPPEQARGRAVDARTDVYALGVVAYEMLVGRVPFEAEDAIEVMAMHLNRPAPDPRAARPELPAELGALVVAMMAKDPADRPSVATVRDVVEGRAALPTVAAPSRPRRRALVVAGAVIAAGAAITVGVFASRPSTTAAPQATSPAPAVVAMSTVTVHAARGEARIEIGGEVVATAAREGTRRVPGGVEQTVRVSAPGWRPFETTVKPAPGALVEVHAVLEAEPPVAAPPLTSSHPTRARGRPTSRGVSPGATTVKSPEPARPPAPSAPSPPPQTPTPADDDRVVDPFRRPK